MHESGVAAVAAVCQKKGARGTILCSLNFFGAVNTKGVDRALRFRVTSDWLGDGTFDPTVSSSPGERPVPSPDTVIPTSPPKEGSGATLVGGKRGPTVGEGWGVVR